MPSKLPHLDFSERADPATLPEWMDGPCSYEDFRDCVRDIAHTTRLTLAYRPTLRFVAAACARAGREQPLDLVDVGSGGGDMLRHLAAQRHRPPGLGHLVGIDLNPFGTRAARELSSAKTRYRHLECLTGDVFTEPLVQHPDLVISSLVTHHMPDAEIIRFLRWMETHARVGWFLSDLVRSARSYRFFALLSRLMRWHPFVQHDGLISIRRGFREADWLRLLAEAGIPAGVVTMRRCALGRLCLSRLR